MSEIFVEEENTVYELDAECLKRKEEQKRRQRDSKEIKTVIMHRKQKQYVENKISRIYGFYVCYF